MKSFIEESILSNFRYDQHRTGYGQPTVPTPILNPNSPSNIGPQQPQFVSSDLSLTPIEMDPCQRLHGWQQQLVGLLGGNDDVYVLSNPGSGKTAPVICYWINNILGISTRGRLNDDTATRLLFTPHQCPQVLWLVPIKALSANIEEEMIERFTSIILQMINKVCSIVSTPNDPSNYYIDLSVGGQYDRNIGNRTVTFMELIIQSLSRFGSGRQIGQNLIHMIFNNAIRPKQASEFKDLLSQLVKNYVENALVGRKEEGISTTTIISRESSISKQPKPFIIAIYESAQNIIKQFTNLKLMIFDESQRIQDSENIDRVKNIVGSIHNVLSHPNGINSKLVLLSGSTNRKSAENLIHFFNVAYHRKFRDTYQTPEDVKNPSYIRVFSMSNLNDEHTQLRIAQNVISGNSLDNSSVVFIIFSKKRINNLIDRLAPSEIGYSDPRERLKVERGHLFNHKTDVSTITDQKNILDISDERLRRATSNGIGYLYRPEELTPQRQRDMVIIQNLFRNGKIKILFATESVKEGINITCNTIYIPTILLPPNNREMNTDSLTQLINRVGRRSDKYATIYTDQKYVKNITFALSSSPDKFNIEPFLQPGFLNKYIRGGLNYKINLPIQIIINLYNLIFGGLRPNYNPLPPRQVSGPGLPPPNTQNQSSGPGLPPP